MDMELNTPSLEILDPGFMEAINRSVPAPFLIKTYQLVDDPATDHIVSWSNDTQFVKIQAFLTTYIVCDMDVLWLTHLELMLIT